MELNQKNRKKFECWMKKARTRNALMAFLVANPEGVEFYKTTEAACTGQIKHAPFWFNKNLFLCVPYNGESPKDKGSGGLTGFSRETHKFEGGPVSLEWLKFLTNPNHIWKDVLPFIVNLDDLEKINEETGFIFRDIDELPSEATLSFLIASRFAQEQNRKAIVWYELVQEGVDPRIAFIYASWFDVKGKTIKPPSHSIGYVGPKMWAKQFYFCRTGETHKAGDEISFSSPSMRCPYGLSGENAWLLNKSFAEAAKIHPMETFFNTSKTTGRNDVLKIIEDFIHEGEDK